MLNVSKNFIIDGKYTVLLFNGKGANVSQIHHSSFDSEGNLLEIEFLKRIKHRTLSHITTAARRLSKEHCNRTA
jgi:hypothetical protein